MDSATIIAPSAEPPKSLALPFEPLPQFRRNALEETPERADNHGKRIGIFIVAYNALTTLSGVLKRITPDVWRNVEQVAVFDDASKDETYELAVGIQAMVRQPKLRVLKHPKNLGYGGNQKAGYRYFIEQGFDIVVLLHGDGQYAPELLSHMYAPLVRGEADAVFGSRMMKDFGGPLKGGMPLYKYVGNRILTAFENRALGLHLTEFHSGYRAYNLRALKQICLDNMTDDFHFDTEIIIKLHHQGFRIKEVPIPTFYGDEVCYVNGTKYAKAIVRAVNRYHATARAVRCFPEYDEYFVRYAPKRSRYSCSWFVSRLIGRDQRVLEVAPQGSGLRNELSKAGNHVVTVDGAALIRSEGLRCDIRSEGPYDRVILLDTLEHVPEPAEVLHACGALLAARGRLIVSVPNAANITVRLPMLFGSFRYADRGILDWSHLRLFTKATTRELVERSGFRVTGQNFSIMPVERMVSLSPDNLVLRLANRFLRLLAVLSPGLFAYEILLVAERAE